MPIVIHLFDTFPIADDRPGHEGKVRESQVVFVESGARSFGATGNYSVKVRVHACFKKRNNFLILILF